MHPEQGAFFDLSARTKLRITGADRQRYLNGQISNDIRKATEQAAIYACVLSAKGKINADVFIRCDGESFLVDADPNLREQLAARLERYVIADDVQIDDVTDDFALFHLLGGAAVANETTVQAHRLGVAGSDIWAPRDQHDAIAQRLTSMAPFCDTRAAEILRIERGLPRWGHELTEEIIPTEANLESSAIDYTKGCYIGQEVISRIKMSGQTNKRLCGFITTADVPLEQGMKLWTTGDESREVGWISSATQSARLGSQIALGFIKRGYQVPGTQLEARAATSSLVQVVALPFV